MCWPDLLQGNHDSTILGCRCRQIITQKSQLLLLLLQFIRSVAAVHLLPQQHLLQKLPVQRLHTFNVQHVQSLYCQEGRQYTCTAQQANIRRYTKTTGSTLNHQAIHLKNRQYICTANPQQTSLAACCKLCNIVGCHTAALNVQPRR